MPVFSNSDLLLRFKQEINTAEAQGRMTPDVMFLVEAVKEINRLNEALSACGLRVEELYHFINEHQTRIG